MEYCLQLCRIFPRTNRKTYLITTVSVAISNRYEKAVKFFSNSLQFFEHSYLTVKKIFLSIQQLQCTILKLLTVLSGICSANCRNRISGRHNQLIAVARVVGSLRLSQDKVEKIQPEQNNGLQVNEIYHIIRLFKLS